MNDEVLKGILQRLAQLERNSVHFRKGVVTATAPLNVKLGGSTVIYTDVRTVSAIRFAELAITDVVACLVSGNQLLVLGKIL